MACDRNIEPYQPGEEARAPDLARIFPGPPGGAASPEEAASQTGQTPRGALPPSRAAGSEVAATANAVPEIEGEITLDPALARARPDGAVLFVIARPEGVRGGPPLAVLRIPSPEFPLAFSIGPDDVMIPSMQFVGPISISARLDADGNAMTRSPEDISSETQSPLEPGATQVRLTLARRG
jgi:hypothetical protein